MEEFQPFEKIARLSRECVITEKLDGTNAQIFISEEGEIQAGSRGRYLTVGKETDNFGFARWVADNAEELKEALGPGRHFGEWWGKGIQRGYNQIQRHFSLFNTRRWGDVELPSLLKVVPTLYTGDFDTANIQSVLDYLRATGSIAAPGFPYPEGIIIYHKAANILFKKTLEADEVPKGRH